MPEPKNATEEEQKVDDFNKSSNQPFEAAKITYPRYNELQISLKNEVQINYNEVIIPQRIKKRVDIDGT
ncbi:hypothetical protein C1645_818416 [Glomus cerebriforme]|uniref:Uncharacterized protein n=1 Tax=Glomus cerebriforme TaxID=658196 RepID=A0A397TGU3_9GLOM|nr:hypothetical protein C1645_818416 [Glomus cerebriforme]